MSERFLKGLSLSLVTLLIVGCTGTGGIRTRTYIEEKPRVDQEMAGGNCGYLQGTPAAPDRSQYKKTRKMYVLEITKDVPDVDALESEAATATRRQPASQPVTLNIPPEKEYPEPKWTKPIELPALDEQPAVQPSGETVFIDYEIQKGDTLQKISKKFYDSYSKWLKIYEANKDIIKDPNRLKPGMVIKVPTQEAQQVQEQGENLK